MIPIKYRAWLYRAGTTALVAASVFALVNDKQRESLERLLAALVTGLAAVNTPTSEYD